MQFKGWLSLERESYEENWVASLLKSSEAYLENWN